ncbi:nucleotidyltransferase family protein [Caldanaerobius polysaccharolyticus]|uniref:nucleotidyltransferase family protein n=1 Tax=Caldanaerobius polysaccharolyticus TaxID=44256 RepID=UPI000479F433|nr:nucleotidyltransferase family protein [Caldanaerobius polysaccharolyticus]
MLNAIVLAGSGDGDKLPDKPLLKIKDKPMILYVTDALKASGIIDRIVVVGNAAGLSPLFEGDDCCTVLDGGGNMLDNLLLGVRYLGDQDRVLVLTSDIPMITPEAIIDFVEKAKAIGGDFCYPIVKKEVNKEKFPKARRTYARLREGTFTGGNIIYMNPRIIDNLMDMAYEVIENRKRPIKLVRMLGWSFTMKFLLGRLTIPKVEERVSKMLGIDARAVISEYPEIGNDVDKPSDVEMAENYIKSA